MDLRQALHLRDVRILPTSQEGLSGVKKKLTEAMMDGTSRDEYWCVVDHDERDEDFDRFNAFVAEVLQRKTRPKVRVVLSKPCFEYWFLLHFIYTTKAFQGSPGRSACAQVIAELKRHLPDYRKNDPRLFVHLEEHLEEAIERAKRGRTAGSSYTEVGELVERLLRLGGDGSA